MKKYLIIILLLSSCNDKKTASNKVIELSNSLNGKEEVVTPKKVQFDEEELTYSNFSFIQANKSGLYVTPAGTFEDYVLYRYEIDSNVQMAKRTGIIKEGRGPNEIERISMSSKAINGDTLLFGSAGSKTLAIDDKGFLFEWEFDTRQIPNYGYSFSYNKGKLLIPSFNPAQTAYLFRIYDLGKDSSYFSFTPRVPYGYQPSIRNEVLGETPIPKGFAISFLGDKKVYVLNFKGEVTKEIILGESDEIPKPYKVNSPQESPGAKPYITKMEFFNEHLLVLMDNTIWILEYPSFSLKMKIKLSINETNETSPVIDFSISDNYLFSRIGRSGIYYTETNASWFNSIK
ncbi:MAG: hypothetical protein RJQ00_02600 [Vicingaceae bacterium]|jgi:hypothetical protein